MLALVTGSTGFIGSHICRALISKGYQVRAFHRPSSSTHLIDDMYVEHAIGDILKPDTIEKAMNNVDIVFHTAAKLGLPKNPADMYSVTVIGTRNLLDAAIKNKVQRVVRTSSVAALGVPIETKNISPSIAINYKINENHTWNFPPEWWRYGHSKYLAELEIQKAIVRGLDVVIVNPAIVIGDGDIHKVGGGILVYAAQGNPLASISGGLSVIHINDAVEGHLAALERGATGKRYILTKDNLSIKDFISLIAKVTGRRPPTLEIPTLPIRIVSSFVSTLHTKFNLPFSPDLLHQAGYYFFYDHHRSKQQLNFTPKFSIETALIEALSWYKQNGYI